MRLGLRCLALSIAALALTATHRALPLEAQEPVRVEEIRLDPPAHVNQVRVVIGVVERLVSRNDDGTAFYLEDDFGHQVMVLPFGEVPAPMERPTPVMSSRAGSPTTRKSYSSRFNRVTSSWSPPSGGSGPFEEHEWCSC